MGPPGSVPQLGMTLYMLFGWAKNLCHLQALVLEIAGQGQGYRRVLRVV